MAATNNTNWCKSVAFQFAQFSEPTSVSQVQQLVTAAKTRNQQVRVVGSAHSFNQIANTTNGVGLSLINMTGLASPIDTSTNPPMVSIHAGSTYGDICSLLHEQGFALHNLASLPHVTIAGAVATGTHGSGVGNRNLADSVVAITLVDSDGVRARERRAAAH
jgi:xylitol oxidase